MTPVVLPWACVFRTLLLLLALFYAFSGSHFTVAGLQFTTDYVGLDVHSQPLVFHLQRGLADDTVVGPVDWYWRQRYRSWARWGVCRNPRPPMRWRPFTFRLSGVHRCSCRSSFSSSRYRNLVFACRACRRGVLALGLNYGAYMTEIMRAGIQSVGAGQREAAQSVGLTRFQIMRFIVLPQALRLVIPPIGNQFIAMLKDTSLISVTGLCMGTAVEGAEAGSGQFSQPGSAADRGGFLLDHHHYLFGYSGTDRTAPFQGLSDRWVIFEFFVFRAR